MRRQQSALDGLRECLRERRLWECLCLWVAGLLSLLGCLRKTPRILMPSVRWHARPACLAYSYTAQRSPMPRHSTAFDTDPPRASKVQALDDFALKCHHVHVLLHGYMAEHRSADRCSRRIQWGKRSRTAAARTGI